MTITTDTKTRTITFKSSNASWTRPIRNSVGHMRINPAGVELWWELLELNEWEKSQYSWATHMAITRAQNDQLCVFYPVAKKSNSSIWIKTEDDKPEEIWTGLKEYSVYEKPAGPWLVY